MSMNYYLVWNRPSTDSGLHIGKSSAGWRFLFHKVSHDTEFPLNSFEQWRNYLRKCTESGTHVIMNEQDEVVSYEEFMRMVSDKQNADRPDMFRYCENINGYRFRSGEFR